MRAVPKRAKGRATVLMAMSAAQQLYSEVGPENLTIKMVSDFAGLHEDVLYRYFRGAPDLSHEVAQERLFAAADRIRKLLDGGFEPSDMTTEFLHGLLNTIERGEGLRDGD